jgi:predicted dehydrogenase
MQNSPRKVLRVLLVGVGNRGRWPLQQCRPEAGWEVAGLVDKDAGHLAAAREATGLPEAACFGDIAEGLKAVSPDAAILCTPTTTHAPFTKEAIARGVAVLTEKGMASNWDEARDLVRFVEEHRGTFAVAQNYRYDGLSSVVRAALRGGTDGIPQLDEPFLVDYVQHRVRPVPGTLTYPFASIWDMSCHHFDNLLDWLGPVEDVTAHAPRAPWSPYAHAANTSAFLRFANGVAVNYVHTHDAARGSLRIGVHARNGAVVLCDGAAEFSPRPTQNFGEVPPLPLPVPVLCSEERMLAEFHDYVVHGREPGISGRRNLETMALCEMCVRSIGERRTIQRSELET